MSRLRQCAVSAIVLARRNHIEGNNMSASLPAKTEPDLRKPNEKRLDDIIEQNDDILETNRAILIQVTKMNVSLITVGAELIKMAENAKKGKKVVDIK